MNRKIFKLALILLLAFGLSSPTFAQGRLTGSISGIVVDDQGHAIPGATVSLSGPALMGTKSYVTSDTGDFRFVALLPGEYEIKAEMSGFNSFIQKGLYCSVGKIAECKITLTPTALKTEITVVAASPTIDVQSTKMAVNYGKDFLLALPNARDLYGIQDSIPGSIRAESNREYTRMSSILGSTIRSTLYQLDGAGMNDPTTTYVAANINVDVYDEVEISIGALPAEVGQTETALINIISKSGGNKFSGMISGFYTGTGDKKSIKFLPDLSESLWTDEQIAALKVNPPGTYADYKDGSIGLGGPIIKDKLWFYLNGRALSQVTLLPFTPENRMAVLAAAKPGQIDPRDLVHYDMDHQEAMVFSKLTFALTKNIRYSGMFSYNMVNEPVYSLRTGNAYARSYTALVDHEKTYVTAHQINWILDQNTFLDIRGNYVNRHFPNNMPREYSNAYQEYDRKIDVYWGSTIYTDDYYRKRYGASASITRFEDYFLGGKHEFKAGGEWEDTYYIRDRCRGYEPGDNPWRTYWYDFAAGNKYYYSTSNKQGRLYLYPFGEHGLFPDSDNTRRFSGFIQDSFVTGRLAINLGFRVDYTYAYEPEQSRPSLLDRYKVGPEFLNPNLQQPDPNLLLKALNDQYHQQIYPVSDVDAFTFPYRRIATFTTFSPRIGLVYDLFGDGKTALKLSFSRYYEPLFSGKYNNAQPLHNTLNWRWNDLNGNGYMDLPRVGPTDPKYIDPKGDSYELTDYFSQDPTVKYYADNIKNPYMNEVIAGIEHEVMKDFRARLEFIYKENKNLTEDIDRFNGYDPNKKDDQGRPVWLPYTFTDPGWDGKWGTSDDKEYTVYGLASYAHIPDYPAANPPEAKRRYIAGVLTFEKRMSNKWQLSGSITVSSFKGNILANYDVTEGASTRFDNPNARISEWGSIDYDRPLQIKILGTYILPYNFVVSAYFQYLSGDPWGRTLARVYYPPALAAQTQATYATILAEPLGTRRGPAITTLDLRLEKDFSFGAYARLNIFADIFNVAGNRTLGVTQDPTPEIYFYENPPRIVQSANLGRINTVNGVRSIRLGGRFSF